MEKNNSLDMFYGYWKYLGINGTFFFGIALFWWGTTLAMTYDSLVAFIPLALGAAISWLSFAEFLRIIRQP